MTKTVFSQCRICINCCGIEIEVDEADNRVLSIQPDRQNPHTWMDFCRKGKSAAQVVEHPQRITQPMRRVGDKYEPASYEDAIGDIAQRLNAIIERHGPDAVGSYVGNPMGFEFGTTAFLNGLLDAIGSGNRFWVGSVDTNAMHYVSTEMYGSGLLILPPDLDNADCLLLVGMDPATSKFVWSYNAPDGWNRVLARQREGADLIVVDPRRSVSAEQAGTHLAVYPGQDWALLLAMVKVIFDEGLEHPSRTLPTTGLEAVRRLAGEADLGDLATRCGIEPDVIRDVARRFARARSGACITHTGASHNEFGTLAEWLGNVINLLCDRIDTPGGRGLVRGLIDIGPVEKAYLPSATHHSRLRGLPALMGFHSLAELADEITTPGEGQIKAMLVFAGNPVVSGANGPALDKAFEGLDLLVAFDLVQRESHRHADWLMPGTHWLERSDLHVLFSGLQDKPYTIMGRQAVQPPEGVRAEWELYADLALALDRNLFGRPGVNRILRASRRLAKATGRPGLRMNPDWFYRLLVAAGRRVKYREILEREHGWVFGERTYGDLPGTLLTDDKAVHAAPPALLEQTRVALRSPLPRDAEFPLQLINKRTREAMNSWLNELPGLHKAGREVTLDIHPDDAARLGVADGDLVAVTSATGELEVQARFSEAMRPGVVCLPHGWGSRVFDPATGEATAGWGVNRNALVDSRRLDPLSQMPSLGTTAVRVRPLAPVPAG